MIRDKQASFSEEQAVTATAVSTNVHDAGVANRAIDQRELELCIQCVETAVSGGSSTLTVALQDSADNSSFADVVLTPAIAKATLVAGYEIRLPLPPRLRRYTRLNYTVAVADLTAGKFNAFLTPARQDNRAMPSGFSIA